MSSYLTNILFNEIVTLLLKNSIKQLRNCLINLRVHAPFKEEKNLNRTF